MQRHPSPSACAAARKIVILYNAKRFSCLFLEELQLLMYGNGMEPVRLPLKPRKDNGEVAKRNVVSEIKKYNDALAYPTEELIEEEKKVLEDIRSAKTPVYHAAGDMFEALNRELDCER